jgi:transposase
MKSTPQPTRALILDRLNAGQSSRSIAKTTGVGKSTINDIRRKFSGEKNILVAGRSRKI